MLPKSDKTNDDAGITDLISDRMSSTDLLTNNVLTYLLTYSLPSLPTVHSTWYFPLSLHSTLAVRSCVLVLHVRESPGAVSHVDLHRQRYPGRPLLLLHPLRPKPLDPEMRLLSSLDIPHRTINLHHPNQKVYRKSPSQIKLPKII